MITLQAASLVYEDHGKPVFACQDVDLSVQPGEFLGILGPSGSGKSSLLYLLSGLKRPTAGTVLYNGKPLADLDDLALSKVRLAEFGFVFQYPYLIGYLTALENVLLAVPGSDSRDEARSLLQDLGIQDQAHRYPHELSGGQKQRVCIARALLGGPKAVFADEPTAALDHANGTSVMQLMRTHRGSGALIVVTHDPVMLEGADRIVEIEDGRIALAHSV